MTNGHEMLDKMEFERELEKMGDDPVKLIKFTAWRVYEISKLCPAHLERIQSLERRGKKEMGGIGGLGAVIGAAIVGVIDYLMRR